jgi:hypothetical protein
MTSSLRKPFALLVALVSCSVGASDARRSGTWWGAASPDERSGYLAGYLACEVYDAGKNALGEVRWEVLEKTISERYRNGSEPLSTPVGALAVKLGALQERSPPDGVPEIYPEKYGFFDGEFWRQSSKDARQGFIEGYVDCCRDEGIKGAGLTGSPQTQVSAISEWYGIRDDGDAIDATRRTSKVPDVLRRASAGR